MAVTASYIETPPVVSLQGNPCVIGAGSSLANATDIYMHLRIQELVAGAWTDTAKEDSLPLISGYVEFDVSGYLEDEFTCEFAFPEHHSNLVIPRPGMIKPFRVKIWETYLDAQGVLQDKIAEAFQLNQTLYMLPGGISEDDQALLNTLSTNWWDEWVSRKSFQHWLPATGSGKGKKTSIKAVEKLFWLARRTATETVSIAWIASDASTGTVNVAFDMAIYTMYELCVSPAIAEQLAGKALASYTVTIAGQSETVGYTIDRTYFENNEYFLLQNSFGCFENLWCHGARSGEMEFNRTQYERSLGSKYELTDRKLGSTRAMVTRNRKSNTGYFRNPDWFNWALALVAGEDAWIYTATSLAPVVMTSEKTTYIDDMQEDPWALEIEWKHSREGRFGGGLGLSVKFIFPPYFSKLAAFFYKIERGALVDKIAGLTAPQSGANITWPNIAASDVLDFSDATFWNNALLTAWYNAGSPRTCPLAFMDGSEWAEAATDATHARLFHRDTTGSIRSIMPVLVYNQNLTAPEQAVVVAWLEWYFVIFESGSVLTENGNILIQ